MFDTIAELLEKLRLGEDTYLESKAVRFAGGKVAAPHRDSLADELASMANSRGGVCLLGAEDETRDATGIPLEHLDTVEDFVREVCTDSIKPGLAPVIERLFLPDATGTRVPIIKVEVPRSLFVHQSPGGYLYRIGSAKRQMPPDYLARLFQQRSQTRFIHFDEQTVAGSRLDELDPSLCRRFAGLNQGGLAEDLPIKLGMARKDGDGVVRPTVAGVLMATPEPRRWLPNAFVQAVAYRGTTVSTGEDGIYQLDASDISGPLDKQITDTCAFVRKNMKVAAIKRQGRTDLPEYDMTAIFEAVVNAVAHRDYSIHGSKIRLKMFADRLEIYSPGTIPNTMTIESLPYRQSARNETLTSLLARCPVGGGDWAPHRSHMMDKRGEGVPIILERSRQLSGREPQYRLIDDTELMLTVWAARPDKYN
ncbi:MAG: putative DNA binding domain-containing protein [Deltaproteobacteria bacterium]|nr:putative DNA binding domain-containing protein [Deltaproteobacteria bacterium]